MKPLSNEEAASEQTSESKTAADSKSDARLGKHASPDQKLLKLRHYFDEHSGIVDVNGRNSGQHIMEHGDVVKALEHIVADRGDTQKAQAIDLAVVASVKVDLFEVKTSAKTTAVYTGVGQLLIHGESITQLLNLPVQRYLVLPEHPNKEHERHIIQKGHMRIVTYRKVADGYKFDGL